jgi:hypothetical protein
MADTMSPRRQCGVSIYLYDQCVVYKPGVFSMSWAHFFIAHATPMERFLLRLDSGPLVNQRAGLSRVEEEL